MFRRPRCPPPSLRNLNLTSFSFLFDIQQAMDAAAQTASWGSLALVSYIPDPLGSFLNRLRHSLTGEECPHAHVTMLPPRRLTVPLELASQQLLSLLDRFESFPVELSSVRHFHQTNVLYLDVAEGNANLHALHDALNEGDLAQHEEFEFLPHLTLGCPNSASDPNALHRFARESWDQEPLNRSFLLHEVVCLWLPPNGLTREWGRLWSYNLKTRQTVIQPPVTLAATNQTY